MPNLSTEAITAGEELATWTGNRFHETLSQIAQKYIDQATSTKDKRIADLEFQVLQREKNIATDVEQIKKLKSELAYITLQRNKLLEMTWLDLPSEPDESTAKWKEEFEKGWTRR
jgi:hypothetical protein